VKKQRKARSSEPPATADQRPANAPLSWRKLWGFRIVAAVGVPVALLGILEGGLRLAGYGYPTRFLKSERHGEREVFVQNNQFGWRFFGPEMARQPYPVAVAVVPPTNTIRIIVFGESAAKGDPDPHFGLSRMLEATLRLRHPGTRFEVINAAMTAINSHAVLPIVRDCVALKADLWVLYLGNNEVVGPFGAGTVFGPQTPPLPLIRSALALKSTRTGQLFESALAIGKSPPAAAEWGGMEMFLEQQVRATDERMHGVYRHFEHNLADIVQLAQQNGVGLVLSTVAVNLKDCAPFGSLHRSGLSASELAQWEQQFQSGITAQTNGDSREALAHFQQAAQLDDTHAELRFRQAQCALALDELDAARAHFAAARDWDTLRFRADARLNEITRKTAQSEKLKRVLLADAERIFAERSAAKLPGDEFFYEHVHLTFEGNYLLAQIIAEQAERLLSARLVNSSPNSAWPTRDDCARRLGWTEWSQIIGWKGILPRLHNPPFTGQFDHAVRMQQLQTTLAHLSATTRGESVSNAITICEQALAATPDDAALYAQLASLRQTAGDLAGAVQAARRSVALLPSDSEAWFQLGLLLARQQLLNEAATAFAQAMRLDPRDVVTLEHLAQTWSVLGKQAEAQDAFAGVFAIRPNLGVAWLHYGQFLEKSGRAAEAPECYRKALTNPGKSLSGLIEIAGFCQSRGWFEAAATNYGGAIALDPVNAQLHVGAGQNLSAIGRQAEALHHALEAVRLAPDFAEAHLLHGLIRGRMGRLAEAETAFRQALRFKPDLLDARLNLGVALLNRDPAAASECFEQVLRQNPNHAAAQKHLQQARLKLSRPR
jgi:tetratricopeptide (TPR) repeat protein